jgi:cell division protease FtsH
MPTSPTPTLLNRLLRRLWDRRRVVAAVAVGVPLLRRLLFGAGAGAPIPSRLFSSFLEDIENDRVKACGITAEFFQVQLTDDAAKRVGGTLVYRTDGIPLTDRDAVIKLLRDHKVPFGAVKPGSATKLMPFLILLLPFAYLAMAYKMMSDQMNPKGDGVGKVKKHVRGERPAVRFSDVAGIDAVRLELSEIVDFIKNPARFTRIGARLPRGVLISGPSGTGKTLLARAVATEAGIPFIFCSASDFVEMLVGRGASRVRELFTQAQRSTPCIVFVDEIDALAKARGGLNSNDEREQTLNQLLTEMDGFDGRCDGVVVIAATNRPEVLDPALTRPGRFDRHVVVPLPDVRGRRAILQVHVRNVVLGSDCDLARVAAQSDGCSGAELANIVNEAALLAVRDNSPHIAARHFAGACRKAAAAKAATLQWWPGGPRQPAGQ